MRRKTMPDAQQRHNIFIYYDSNNSNDYYYYICIMSKWNCCTQIFVDCEWKWPGFVGFSVFKCFFRSSHSVTAASPQLQCVTTIQWKMIIISFFFGEKQFFSCRFRDGWKNAVRCWLILYVYVDGKLFFLKMTTAHFCQLACGRQASTLLSALFYYFSDIFVYPLRNVCAYAAVQPFCSSSLSKP